MSEATNEYELTQPPGDGISSLRFAPSGSQLLVSSWDSVRRRTAQGKERGERDMGERKERTRGSFRGGSVRQEKGVR